MRVRPRPVPVLRLTVLGAAALLVATPAVAGPPAPTTPTAPAPHTQSVPGVGLELTAIEPVTVRPGRTLQVAGVVTTDRTLRDVTVSVEVGTTPYLARSIVSDAAAPVDPDLPDVSPTTLPVEGAEDRLGRLTVGRASFFVRTRTDLLPLGATGVYPLRVRVTAVRDGVTETVATVDTFLPWSPKGAGVRPTRLLWFWPLVDQPRRDSRGAFVDSGLAPQLGPSGRLTELLAAAEGRPVTWLVDPNLLADADATARPARDVDPAVTPQASSDARRWLADLRTTVDGRDVLGLPYGDPDLVAVTRANRQGLLVRGRALGDTVFRAVLGRPARFDLVWPAEGFADDETLRTLTDTGSTSVLLSGDAVPLVDPPSWTPSGRVDLVDNRLAGLLSDPTLDAIVAEPGSGSAALLLARQQFLAQTLLMTVELPSDPRLAVVAPPRRWDPDPDWAASLLDATDRAAWLRPVTVDEALERDAPVVDREAPQLPAAVERETLPEEVPDTAGATQRELVPFRAILTDPSPAEDIQQALLGSMSTAWRPTPELAAQRLADTALQLDADRSKVRIVTREGTMLAESAPLPVTVRNELDQAVAVRLDVVSQDALRLRVTVPDELLTIEAGGSESVSVELDAVTAGQLEVKATLLTPRGRVFAPPVSIPVDVRAYGRIALIVFGLAAALLVLAAGIRIVRRVRSSRRAA